MDIPMETDATSLSQKIVGLMDELGVIGCSYMGTCSDEDRYAQLLEIKKLLEVQAEYVDLASSK